MFFNRVEELNRLNSRYKEKGAQLLIIYGRRRVGKTELIKEFVRDKSHIYFLADLSNEKEQLRQFSERIRLFTNDQSLVDNPFSNWVALFSYLKNLILRKRLIIIIDEYQYLQSSNKAISSIIQKSWDEGLKDTQVFFILCGSYISFMERELLAYKSPLYGRRTAQFPVEPMSLYGARLFFNSYSIKDMIRTYGILGGVPAYLLQFDPKNKVEKNIETTFLYKDAFLFNETRFLLMEELREPRNYFSILKAIAFGATRTNEIVQHSSLERGLVVKYLDVLQNLRIIKREIPVTEYNPEKSRKGIYIIQDQYIKFWFRFIMPNQSFIEEGRRDFVLTQRILPYLDQYLGNVFEKVCVEYLRKINGTQRLPFSFDKIGKFWQHENEIDIIAFDLNFKNILIVECKWTSSPVGIDIFDGLIRKSGVVPGNFTAGKVYYGIFSKSGFTDSMNKIERPDLFLFDLKDLDIV